MQRHAVPLPRWSESADGLGNAKLSGVEGLLVPQVAGWLSATEDACVRQVNKPTCLTEVWRLPSQTSENQLRAWYEREVPRSARWRYRWQPVRQRAGSSWTART